MIDTTRPLADRMRPRQIDDFAGQAHLLGPQRPLRQSLDAGKPHSMVLWGPPGTGKTTLAQMIASMVDAEFLSLSAVMAGVKDIREAAATGRANRDVGRQTLLFVDEVHRFNKSQQDAFLPYIEDGTLLFIGATTENPSFELNNALLSRVRVYILRSLEPEAIGVLIDRAMADSELGLGGRGLALADEARTALMQLADGDARSALGLLELASDLAGESGEIGLARIQEAAAGGRARFDNRGDAFYDLMSALHKSVRGSAPDAALYWFARILEGGCDPLYIARRVVRMASEDIGNADPRALQVALDAWQAQERLGSPEGELAIAQAVTYLASVPKSNAVYMAYNRAMADARTQGSLEVPVHLRNAPTELMKSLGYGHAYRYAHDEPQAYAAGEQYLPDALVGKSYYQPSDRGLEAKIAARLARLAELDAQAQRR